MYEGQQFTQLSPQVHRGSRACQYDECEEVGFALGGLHSDYFSLHHASEFQQLFRHFLRIDPIPRDLEHRVVSAFYVEESVLVGPPDITGEYRQRGGFGIAVRMDSFGVGLRASVCSPT